MVPLSLIEQLEEFETPVIAEALAAMDHPRKYDDYLGGEIRLLSSMPRPLVGVVLTLECDTSTRGGGSDTAAFFTRMDESRQMGVPTVLILKTVGARLSHECVMGDGMAKTMMTAGCRGAITNGGARDLPGIERAGVTLFAAGLACDHASLNYRIPSGPITVGDLTFRDGDLIHGDSNGVRLIPADAHHAIIEACCLTRDFETRSHIMARRSDMSVTEYRNRNVELAQNRADKCKAAYQAKPAR